MAFALSLPSLPKRYQPAAIWSLYVIGLCPGLWYFYLAATGGLGFNPVRISSTCSASGRCVFVPRPAGDAAARSLQYQPHRLSPGAGLDRLYYVLAHFTVYLVLDRGLILSSIAGDILKRPYIMLGMAGLIMLIPLALTSNRWSIRRLGSRWNTLHKLVYLVLIVGVLHFVLARKSITLEPVFYISTMVVLLGYRLVRKPILQYKRARQPRRAPLRAPPNA